MPERDWHLRIYDITDAIEKIQKYTNGMFFSEFHADDRTIDAVLRNLEVIGEAVRHVSAHVIERYNDIPWDKMRALRNSASGERGGWPERKDSNPTC